VRYLLAFNHFKSKKILEREKWNS